MTRVEQRTEDRAREDREYQKSLRTPINWIQWATLLAWVALAFLVPYGYNQLRDDQAAIKSSRHDALLRSCEEQNHRHARTIKTLNREINQLPSAEKARARVNEKFTIQLIDALVPKRDCAIYVAQNTH